MRAILIATLAFALTFGAGQTALPPDLISALEGISANSLRGHVSFLASDLLEGRRTPSKGLEIAAEYIAAQFRRAGIEAAAGEGYFQDGSVSPPSRSPAAAQSEPVPIRNVAGILRGSDVALAQTCVIVSAHYDHLGTRGQGEGDRIYNGANDDASGTAAVLEIASALARLRVKPKRSVLFLLFAGEERGRLGSRYYAEHPLFPLDKNDAQVNLEQLGRTDDITGPLASTAYVTGFDYSDVGPVLEAAGELAGVRIQKHEANSDKFFSASDNFSLAQKGVPAHTISVGYIFPDYHQPGDEWQKLDYENMAKIVRAIAAGVWRLADSPEPVRWNAANPRATPYRQARESALGAP